VDTYFGLKKNENYPIKIFDSASPSAGLQALPNQSVSTQSKQWQGLARTLLRMGA
jgi:uncharacterized protein YbbK (DUF523 family)